MPQLGAAQKRSRSRVSVPRISIADAATAVSAPDGTSSRPPSRSRGTTGPAQALMRSTASAGSGSARERGGEGRGDRVAQLAPSGEVVLVGRGHAVLLRLQPRVEILLGAQVVDRPAADVAHGLREVDRRHALLPLPHAPSLVTNANHVAVR